MIFDNMDLLVELKKKFNEKMEIPEVNPKLMLEMVGGPEFAQKMYDAMFAVFLSGYEYGKTK